MWYIVSKIKFSIMCFNNRMAKRKSKTKTAMTVSNCVFSGIKHFKDMRFYWIGNTRTVIRYADLCFCAFFDGMDINC